MRNTIYSMTLKMDEFHTVFFSFYGSDHLTNPYRNVPFPFHFLLEFRDETQIPQHMLGFNQTQIPQHMLG
jgi:hypothetical protein